MKIVYIISAYKNPHQLVRLVKRLGDKNCSFFIHVDKKTVQSVYNLMHQGLSHLDNVYFLDRHVCYWGDFGHVLATLKGIKEIYKREIDYDYVVLLTGQCYPIKSNSYIKQYLQQSQGKSFIKHKLICSYHQMKRLERWNIRLCSRIYLPIPNKFFQLPIKRPLSKKLGPFYQGSSYWCLSRKCIDYIYKYITSTEFKNRQFIEFFKGVYIPDETFFQTILANSHLKSELINDNLWFISWPSGSYTPSPNILDKSNIAELTSSNKLFARKLDMTNHPEILDLLDELTNEDSALAPSKVQTRI